MEKPYNQNFENHVRIVPAYHFGVFGIFAINLLWSLYRVVWAFSAETVMALLLAVAFLLLFFYARLFALAAQDRVIRLEMRMRLKQLLPADLQPRLNDFTPAQLISLRFAGDAELPELARKVLAENLTDRKAIKRLIKNWQPDFLRVQSQRESSGLDSYELRITVTDRVRQQSIQPHTRFRVTP